ncbi:MAG: hypothetical protein EA384_00300 [Spirochaetaceae bacterium]|nr:MAG: hypothetical protein EA384_00300 [Spirochaetaceae bacterium]
MLYSRSSLTIVLLAIAFSWLVSCDIRGTDGVDGAGGFNSLVRTQHEPSGPNCAVCGTRFQYGLDINRNGILDDDEVEGTVYLCETRDPDFSLHIETLIQGGGGANEVQRVSILPQGAAVCGSYRLRFGEDTHSIPYDATAAEVQAALQLLPGIDMVTVTGNALGPYTIEFGGALSDLNVPQLQAHAVNLR